MAGFPPPIAGNDAAQDRASIDRQNHDGVFPSSNPGAGAGSGAAVGLLSGSTDIRGTITIFTGSIPAAGVIVTVNFAKPYDRAPMVLLTRASGAIDPICYSTNSTATSFTVTASAAISGTVNIHYLVVR